MTDKQVLEDLQQEVQRLAFLCKGQQLHIAELERRLQVVESRPDSVSIFR